MTSSCLSIRPYFVRDLCSSWLASNGVRILERRPGSHPHLPQVWFLGELRRKTIRGCVPFPSLRGQAVLPFRTRVRTRLKCIVAMPMARSARSEMVSAFGGMDTQMSGCMVALHRHGLSTGAAPCVDVNIERRARSRPHDPRQLPSRT